MSIRSSSAAQSRRSNLVQQHPLTCFFVLTYLAAWCLWAPLVICNGLAYARRVGAAEVGAESPVGRVPPPALATR